jgi:hypothetical protein
MGTMSTVHTAAISTADRERRQQTVDNAVHSLAMEGFAVTGEDIEAAAEYVDGSITLDEFIARGPARLTSA